MTSALPVTIKFSVDWKIPWSLFGTITLTGSIQKTFVTSYNNVSLRWQSLLKRSAETDWPENVFYLYYKNGPLEKFNGMAYSVVIVKSDQTKFIKVTDLDYEAIRSHGWGLRNFVDKDSATVRQKYGLKESDALIYRIVLKIPAFVFSYKIEDPLPTTTSPLWLVDLFKLTMSDDPTKSFHSNAKMISRDGHPFYCHKLISFQSAALDAMFHHPPGKNQVENEYEFPGLGTDALKSLIEYLYTGQAGLGGLSTADLIDLADGAEQYNLKPLKQGCASVLWDRVVQEPFTCYQVVRFADLHDDMKLLKYRAMDVLTENSDTVDSSGFGEGEEGKKLLRELFLFACRRVYRFEE